MTKDTKFSEKMEVTDFVFDGSVANVFDDMLSRCIPFYEETNQMIKKLVLEHVKPNTNVYDLGCSTGALLSMLTENLSNSEIRFVGVDNSEAMIKKAKERLEEKQIELINKDLENIEIKNASVVVMNWTLQFIRPSKREKILKKIFEGLTEGGCLIISEKILSENSKLNSRYIKQYYDLKKSKGYSELEIAQKREALENVLIPYKLSENIIELKKVGFKTVDSFFQWYNFASIIAIK
ncbi:carboxy-S-adenosyl-L-methionine synthase CmoA [Candidatus Woesearchaeota archaeon]|jgi:tRNA (cmo5U34)-methyltransferase|nr:carboxy-S-adenosyl-L-methionine synthase CmoA [Candidatus Woesearchaeota archaeon]MBT4367785.1 carboxy-S-adenosyl-L-methionine synthase CmoA [Candidatus Woesearchaeota archaeon]MBT4712273.1 carboxy-S-adenosyl-L-methionine synthase CmoA [Candidatus Woesearchaeota archaeon]MBT6638821.1 carboxy-S-adenosyl-L-methionine synthase CmoA [Candidatus Woesearchaeota archaeon]MBT7134465.1 carboxy-S-adenosyl-L-methionine synthase CmoA [Candidatus Woesearchaeota archaeon]